MSSTNESTSGRVPEFREDEAYAHRLDADDALASVRDQFHVPSRQDGEAVIYLAGNSLGLQPKGVGEALQRELDDWAKLGVEAHFDGMTPWYSYHEVFRESGAGLVGALPGEVVVMNSLTVNLHLMMVGFYRPTAERYAIVMEDKAFPSDTYAVKSQLHHHGLDPQEALITVKPRQGEHLLRTEDVEGLLKEQGRRIALVMLSGVQFFTGQVFDMKRITAAAQAEGCVVGWDLAHAAGNVELSLHDWNVDFAVWCNYKYLNGGPGAVGGCFVHQRHERRADLHRFAGWWGNDPSERFKMYLLPDFVPQCGAQGWQVSNPPILAMAPVKASYAIFEACGMASLRAKSLALTGYLRFLVDRLLPERFEVITPREEAARGCQLSMLVLDRPKALFSQLKRDGVVCDFREPNVIRVAPVPLYNTFHEVWRFAKVLERHAQP